MSQLENEDQPTFGRFSHGGTDATIELNIANRHPVDILRTLAHELVHYKQLVNKQLGQNSGDTGSPAENEAHVVAGVIMRHFDKQYPDYLKSKSISITEDITENFKDGKNPGRKGLAKRSGVNTKASVSSLRKTAKSSSGEKQRMAHWLANMKSGRKKKKANEAVAPHGSPENEFELMKAGTKPAALVNPHTFLELYKQVADELGWPYQQVKIAGHQYDNYVVGQPGEEKRVQRLITLMQDMNANLALGIKPNKHYHIEMGKLLGYSNQDIQDFLKKMNLDEEYKDADYARGGEKMPAAKPGRKTHPLHGKLVGGQ